MSKVSPILLKRLPKELAQLQAELATPSSSSPSPSSTAVMSVDVVDEDICHWLVVLLGPVGTPYSGGKFRVDVLFPPQYPHAAPKVRFLTPIFNPGVDAASGAICENRFENWQPSHTVKFALDSVSALFRDYSGGTVNAEAAQLAQENPNQFAAKAAKHTAQFAS